MITKLDTIKDYVELAQKASIDFQMKLELL